MKLSCTRAAQRCILALQESLCFYLGRQHWRYHEVSRQLHLALHLKGQHAPLMMVHGHAGGLAKVMVKGDLLVAPPWGPALPEPSAGMCCWRLRPACSRKNLLGCCCCSEAACAWTTPSMGELGADLLPPRDPI